MRILKVNDVVSQAGFFIFCGVVEGGILRTGDDVVLLDHTGERESGLVTSVAVADATEGSIGHRLLDEGKPGQQVRVTVRRPKSSTMKATTVIAFEKSAEA
jgi:hypothetical protein